MAKNTFTIRIRGLVVTGKGEAGHFTSIGWVKTQLRDKAKIDPFPGTLNLRVLPDDLIKLVGLKMLAWTDLEPEDKSFCAAKMYPVIVGGKIYGVIVLPDVPDYPPDQLEIISAQEFRSALGLVDGDTVEIEAQVSLPGI